MIYSPSRFVFFHIPRTGGFSVYQAVVPHLMQLGDLTVAASPDRSGAPWWTHSRACEVRPAIPYWDKLWRWSVVRSPWQIAESSYLRIQAHARRLPAEHQLGCEDYHAFIRGCADQPFDEWLRQRLGFLADYGGWWRYMCCDQNGADLGVEAVRYEQLAARWPGLAAGMGIPGVKLPHVNGAVGTVEWTPETIEFVGELCRDDVERFGYEPPAPGAQPVLSGTSPAACRP